MSGASFEAGSVNETSYFGPIVRPYVGQGFWAPNRQGEFVQVNVPSWADGGEPEHTGSFDTWAGIPALVQHSELYLNGDLVKTSEYQGLDYFGLPDGDSELRIVNVAEHDGTWLDSSTSTTTEWTVTSTGAADDYAARLLPMIQATYDLEVSEAGTWATAARRARRFRSASRSGTSRGRPQRHGDGCHARGASARRRLEAGLHEAGLGGRRRPRRPDHEHLPEGPRLRASYEASVAVPDAGGWVDVRVTAKDAAGNTFSQEIERAFEAAPAKGAGHGGHGGRP